MPPEPEKTQHKDAAPEIQVSDQVQQFRDMSFASELDAKDSAEELVDHANKLIDDAKEKPEEVEAQEGEAEADAPEAPDFSSETAAFIKTLKEPAPEGVDLPKAVEISDADYKTAMESEEGMKSLMEKVQSQAFLNVMEKLPELLQPIIQRQSELQTATSAFWQQNPDLKDVSNYVAAVAADIQAKNPTIAYGELLNQAAETTRKNLKLSKQAVDIETGQQDDPGVAVPGRSGVRRGQRSRANNERSLMDGLIDYHKTAPSLY